jgi:hypothetical protein
MTMGNEKQTTETSQQGQQQQTYAPSPQEQEMWDIQLGQARELAPGQTDTAKQMNEVVQNLLAGGGGSLAGVFNKLFTGIDEDMTQQLTQEALGDIAPQFQKSGILDSGVAASIAGRTAGDIRRNVAENNLTRVFNLLQTGLGYGGQQQQLGNQGLAGLTSALKGTGTTSGNFSQSGMSTVTSMNPFLKSFQQGLGTSLSSWASPQAWMGQKGSILGK